MNKYRDIYYNKKKSTPKAEQIIQIQKNKNYLANQQKCEGQKYFHFQSITQHLESQFTKSSRIANQCESSQYDFQSFQIYILKKVEQIQEESNRSLQKKEKQIFNLKIQLENNYQKLKQADQMLVLKDKKISRFEYEIQILKNATQNNQYLIQNKQIQQIQKQNQKLKKSLIFLIEQKNQNWKILNVSTQTSLQNKQNIQKMTQQIEDLKQIVEQLESKIKKCSRCFTLNIQKQQLSIANDCLVKQHLQLTASQSKKEKQFIKSISNKIKQYQNIIRQNLKQPQERRIYTTPKYQGLTDSITSTYRYSQ